MKPGVIISDSFGRPWRVGIVNVAIGVAGLAPLADYRGMYDDAGYELHVTVIAVADELACAAELVSNKLDKRPVTLIRGYQPPVKMPDGIGTRSGDRSGAGSVSVIGPSVRGPETRRCAMIRGRLDRLDSGLEPISRIMKQSNICLTPMGKENR